MTSPNPIQRVADLGKAWARICSHRSWKLIQVPARVRRNIDISRIEGLKREMHASLKQSRTSAAKYADHDYWLSFNVQRIALLSLHEAQPLRLLDIGCGPGYFLAAARACGHDVYGVDIPRDLMTPVERRVYSELLGAMSLTKQVSPLLVERFVPMQLPYGDLDLITAFWVCFNCHRRADEWGAAEWRFFIDDALTHLRKGGVLHLELNENGRRYPQMKWYDQETLDIFRGAGTVHQNVVRIHKK
jgi:SAM-dependent methyltransferase